MVSKLAAYVVVGINDAGRKEVLTVEIGENESSKYWLGVLNRLKNRGVQDILILCSDGLSGLMEAVAAAFPEAEHQRCIVHMVRNTLKYVAHKDMKQSQCFQGLWNVFDVRSLRHLLMPLLTLPIVQLLPETTVLLQQSGKV